MPTHRHPLPHYHLTTCKPGQMVPIGCVEVLPGDTFKHDTAVLLRTTPLLNPLMHPVMVRIHHFFVPTRLLWDEWEDFITGGATPDTPPTVPTIASAADPVTHALLDRLGVPLAAGVNVSALPVRAFNLIYNEWYRDQDLDTARSLDAVTLPRVSWEKDQFTAARPWPQRGDDVILPLGTSAPVVFPTDTRTVEGSANVHREDTDASQGQLQITTSGTGGHLVASAATVPGTQAAYIDVELTSKTDAYADLSAATGVPVPDVRLYFALQRYKENSAMYGTRYTDLLRRFGVKSSDARLQRPEYLGGGRQLIAFSEVLQTAEGATDPVGTMRGHGIGTVRTRRYRRFFEEHGFVMTILSVRPRALYVSGLPKMWLRTTKEDYFQRELENIGAEEITENELRMNAATGTTVFGYRPRYQTYREQPSLITGEFRTSVYNDWHFGRIFTSGPTLNAAFVNCDPDDRPFADQTGADTLLLMVNHRLNAKRVVGPIRTPRIM